MKSAQDQSRIELKQLAADVAAFRQSAGPALLDADSPAFEPDSLAGAGIYFVALVGGKDVGKTSLANAIAGTTLEPPTDTGEGTRTAVAYCHQDAAPAAESRLRPLAGDAFQIVTHAVDALRQQVLLDLPDVDSVYHDHVELVRRVLKIVAFPVLITSVEKYADLRTQQLLARIAEGNDPANFLFVLNKIDQLLDREGPAAVKVVAADHAERLRRRLNLDSLPKVLQIAATRPDFGDLPALRSQLSKGKDKRSLEKSMELASRRQAENLSDWIAAANLDESAARWKRMLDDARAHAAELVIGPILAGVTPTLRDDAAFRLDAADQAATRRISRWPLLGVLDLLASPAVAIVKQNLRVGRRAGPAELLDSLVPPIDRRIGSLFARLSNDHPDLARAVAGLSPESARRDLLETIDAVVAARQRKAVETAAGSNAVWFAPARWLLTVGVALWFAILQPVAAVLLAGESILPDRRTLAAVVNHLSAQSLLASAGMIVLWLVALWLFLRFATHRSVKRQFEKLDQIDDPTVNLDAAVVSWGESLLAPITAKTSQAIDLADRARRLTQPRRN